jgi:hypothetical protein
MDLILVTPCWELFIIAFRIDASTCWVFTYPILLHIKVTTARKANAYETQNIFTYKMEHVGVGIRLWACIRERLGSYLGRDTGYPDWDFSRFSSISPAKLRGSTSDYDSFLPNAFQYMSHPTIRRYIS